MTVWSTILVIATFVAGGTACATHTRASQGASKRATPKEPAIWAYEASYNWGRLDPNYALCQTGTQQSPIPLSLNNGLASSHRLSFNYPTSVAGTFHNWGYGPAFTVKHNDSNVWVNNPSISFDDVTGYLAGWHIHAPADHTVAGDRSKAELHLVHVDASGREVAVLALRLDPGQADNEFFSQLPHPIGFNETLVTKDVSINMGHALSSVFHFNEFWTYEGSLTSPPCTEGIRWFVARQIMFTGTQQMRDLLGASTYSARAEQEVWRHRINV